MIISALALRHAWSDSKPEYCASSVTPTPIQTGAIGHNSLVAGVIARVQSNMESPSPKPGWLERLGALLMREPEDREQLIELLRSSYERNLLDSDSLSMT